MMSNPFFDHPILNSPYEYPRRHWELVDGQPTQKTIESRRRADFITPIPKPKKRKSSPKQGTIVFDEGKGLSTEKQQYDPTPIINEVRGHVAEWRAQTNPSQWGVTPETARLLQHWRHHEFGNQRPFFCQVEAAEKVLDILWQERRQRSATARAATEFVDQHLDPLLKSADELTGKIRSLTEKDFREVRGAKPTTETLEASDFGSLVYLFARFWAQIEIIRQEGIAVPISQDPRGKRLQSFLDCLESRRVRIVDRISQRAIGESAITGHDGKLRAVPFVEFVKLFETDAATRRWAGPLIVVLSRTHHTQQRQRLL